MILTERSAGAKMCPVNKSIFCKGSKCMGWVWVRWKQVDGKREFTQDTDQCLVRPHKGRCGMTKGGCD